jgi:hypothetical protein
MAHEYSFITFLLLEILLLYWIGIKWKGISRNVARKLFIVFTLLFGLITYMVVINLVEFYLDPPTADIVVTSLGDEISYSVMLNLVTGTSFYCFLFIVSLLLDRFVKNPWRVFLNMIFYFLLPVMVMMAITHLNLRDLSNWLNLVAFVLMFTLPFWVLDELFRRKVESQSQEKNKI